jgi:hypothetical protein
MANQELEERVGRLEERVGELDRENSLLASILLQTSIRLSQEQRMALGEIASREQTEDGFPP